MDKLVDRYPFLNGSDWSTFPEDVQNYLKHLYMTYNGTLNGTRGVANADPSTTYWVKIHPIVMATIVSVTTVAGIIGNVLVCYSMLKSNEIKTGSNALLVNLCIASLIFLTVCAPILIFHDLLYFDWVFGLLMCKLVPYTMHVALYVITYTLAIISLYQYVAVTYPNRFVILCSQKRTLLIIGVSWATFLVLNVPHLVGYQLEGRNSSMQCYHKDIVQDKVKAKIWCALYFTFFLSLPLVVMMIVSCFTLYRVIRPVLPLDYQRISNGEAAHKWRVTLIALISLLLFSICWIPFQIMLMLGTFHSIQHWSPAHTIFLDVGMCLAYVNPSINPYIYMLLHPDVKRAVLEQICIGKRRENSEEQLDRQDVSNEGSDDSPHTFSTL